MADDPERFPLPEGEFIAEEVSAFLAAPFDLPELSPEERAADELRAQNTALVLTLLAEHGLELTIPTGKLIDDVVLESQRQIEVQRSRGISAYFQRPETMEEVGNMVDFFEAHDTKMTALIKEQNVLMTVDRLVDAVPTGDAQLDDYSAGEMLASVMAHPTLTLREKRSITQTLKAMIGDGAFERVATRIETDGTLEERLEFERELAEDTVASDVLACLEHCNVAGALNHDDWPSFVVILERAVRAKKTFQNVAVSSAIDNLYVAKLQRKAEMIGLPPDQLQTILIQLGISPY